MKILDPAIERLIDGQLFVRWMTENIDDFSTAPFEISRLAGGRSNLTLMVAQGERKWVMRRPPLGPYPPSAHDMAREFQFYSGVQGTGVPVPPTRGLCEDPAVLGAPFFVMDYVDGRVINTQQDAEELDVAGRRALCVALVECMAKVHAVDTSKAGLGRFAREGSYVERQIRRLTGQWRGFDVSENPAINAIGQWLASELPQQSRTTIVHGDFRIGNLMTAHDDPGTILAVLDWELASVGDPLADLGYSLIFWGSKYPYLDPSNTIPDLHGFIEEEELVALYEEAAGIQAQQIEYYKVLAWFKLAVLSQSHIKRARINKDDRLERIVKHRDAMAAAAMESIERSGS